MNITDTIAAVSTPRGKGGVALLRVSGTEAAEIAGKVFKPKSGKSLCDIAPRTAAYGDIYSFEPDGSVRRVDDGIAVLFRAPSSFTGEDTVELTCHGGVLITQTVLSALLCAGARMAQAGEFTRRAFIAGRLGLSEAEALGSLLEARTHEQLLLSRGGMDGALASQTRSIYEELRRLVSDIYARVDFPDEDLAGMSRAELTSGVAAVHDRLTALASTYRTGRAVAEGIRTVICGRTNSGKSSLYNRLTGSDSAIVTDIEGTTRDVLEATVSFGGITLNLCDTAGLREGADVVEALGIERTRRAIDSAELILAVFDGSKPLCDDDISLIEMLRTVSATVIPVINKSDLTQSTDALPALSGEPVHICALTGDGMDALAHRVGTLFADGSIDLSHDAVAVNARQYAALSHAAELTSQSLAALNCGLPEDICCSDLEVAMSALSEIDGREVTADIVSEIFSHFCVGK